VKSAEALMTSGQACCRALTARATPFRSEGAPERLNGNRDCERGRGPLDRPGALAGVGRYDYALARDGRDWRITAHKFTVTGETGSRDVFGPAAAAAKARPNAYIVRQQARQVVMDFLTGLRTRTWRG
jgi:hypothetical protein